MIVGVITRTDLLSALVRRSRYYDRQPPSPYQEDYHPRTRMVHHFMKERLPDWILDTLKELGQVGESLEYDTYVVGGFVRDLFQYRQNEDLDVVVEGDGILFAKEYAKKTGARIHSYAKFGTAVIIRPDNFKIDVASARTEYYRFPADLPTVEMSSIKLDLFRRDFTINTLAIQLNPASFGKLIDFFSAQKDIKEKVIRILHNLSFVEDPTRAFRAIRFEQRFGFTIGKLTSGLIKNAIRMDFFSKMGGRRIFSEFKLILEEENVIQAIKRLDDFDLLSIIFPGVNVSEKMIARLSSVKNVLSWYRLLFLEEKIKQWMVYFLAFIEKRNEEDTRIICEKLELPPRHRSIFLKDRFEAKHSLFVLTRKHPLENSELYRILKPYRIEILLYMMARTGKEDIKRAISLFISQLRYISPEVNGNDIRKLGIKPGPLYKEILDAVLDAKLNGRLKNRNDELVYMRNYVASIL